ncbi:MAG: YajQ family cyclic di-GMP-binding protein [Acidobacteria bacterium]|nr:YajQ family cyclic di-GMP-binding protein [Acidobacteriota bacterium]
MAQENSFDVVSKLDMQEVANAILQAKKEIETRFDFKGSKSEIELKEKESEILLSSDDEVKLKSVRDVLEGRLVKRKVHLKSLDYQKVDAASMGTVKQRVKLIQGIDSDKAKAIVKAIKETKLKVQASIQGDQVRVAGKNRDDLQKVIQLLRDGDFGAPLQFVNYR